jgi:hypothetical protein
MIKASSCFDARTVTHTSPLRADTRVQRFQCLCCGARLVALTFPLPPSPSLPFPHQEGQVSNLPPGRTRRGRFPTCPPRTSRGRFPTCPPRTSRGRFLTCPPAVLRRRARAGCRRRPSLFPCSPSSPPRGEEGGIASPPSPSLPFPHQ